MAILPSPFTRLVTTESHRWGLQFPPFHSAKRDHGKGAGKRREREGSDETRTHKRSSKNAMKACSDQLSSWIRAISKFRRGFLSDTWISTRAACSCFNDRHGSMLYRELESLLPNGVISYRRLNKKKIKGEKRRREAHLFQRDVSERRQRYSKTFKMKNGTNVSQVEKIRFRYNRTLRAKDDPFHAKDESRGSEINTKQRPPTRRCTLPRGRYTVHSS